MSELFEDAPMDEEEEFANERAPLAGSRSRSRSGSRSPERLSIEPPELKDDDASRTDMMGRLFGQEIRPGSSRKNSSEPPRAAAAAGGSMPGSGTHTPERRAGGYQSVSANDND